MLNKTVLLVCVVIIGLVFSGCVDALTEEEKSIASSVAEDICDNGLSEGDLLVGFDGHVYSVEWALGGCEPDYWYEINTTSVGIQSQPHPEAIISFRDGKPRFKGHGYKKILKIGDPEWAKAALAYFKGIEFK